MRFLAVVMGIVFLTGLHEAAAQSAGDDVDGVTLPPPGFSVDRTRGDPSRPVRESSGSYDGPLFDTHVHLDPPRRGREADLDNILSTARKAGVIRLNVMPTPNEGRMGEPGSGARVREEMRIRDRGVTVSCGSDSLTVWMHEAAREGYDEADLRQRLDALAAEIDSGRCAGLGEIGLFHFTKWGHQAVVEIPPTFPPFLELVALAARKGVWLDLHAEAMEPEGRSREDEVFGLVALLYQRHQELKLILSHTAMTNPVNARRLLESYPGLMMNFKLVTDHSKWRNLEPVCDADGALYEDWARLMEAMPDRFMVGTDAKFGRDRFPARKYRREIKRIRKALGSLDPTVAQKIAIENGIRVFGE